jgi:hypothetical protein
MAQAEQPIFDWLEDVKHGFGTRYVGCFDRLGYEDTSDLEALPEDERAELLAALGAEGALKPQKRRISCAIDALGESAGVDVGVGDAGGSDLCNWFRFSKVALDIVPSALRRLVRDAWKTRYGDDWRDGASHGVFLCGGTLPPCTERMPGAYSVCAGSKLIRTTEDVSAVIKVGDCVCIRIVRAEGGDEACKFVWTCGHKHHRAPREHKAASATQVEKGRIFVSDTFLFSGDIECYAAPSVAQRIPPAEKYNGMPLDSFIREKIATGDLNQCDTTALNFMLIGEKNHQLLPRRGEGSNSKAHLLECRKRGTLSRAEWVQVGPSSRQHQPVTPANLTRPA